MRQISCEELVSISDAYTGKQVQVFLSPIQSMNTYQCFRCRDDGDNLEFYDININKPTMQELIISKDSIEEINYFEDKNIYKSAFSIILGNGQVDFCISEKPMICKNCNKLLDRHFDPSWQINQVGGYGSQWDNERVVIDLCENCLLKFLGYKDGEIDE